jgi:hypothetical protein
VYLADDLLWHNALNPVNGFTPKKIIIFDLFYKILELLDILARYRPIAGSFLGKGNRFPQPQIPEERQKQPFQDCRDRAAFYLAAQPQGSSYMGR